MEPEDEDLTGSTLLRVSQSSGNIFPPVVGEPGLNLSQGSGGFGQNSVAFGSSPSMTSPPPGFSHAPVHNPNPMFAQFEEFMRMRGAQVGGAPPLPPNSYTVPTTTVMTKPAVKPNYLLTNLRQRNMARLAEQQLLIEDTPPVKGVRNKKTKDRKAKRKLHTIFMYIHNCIIVLFFYITQCIIA